jgi:hypothetical protein
MRYLKQLDWRRTLAWGFALLIIALTVGVVVYSVVNFIVQRVVIQAGAPIVMMHDADLGESGMAVYPTTRRGFCPGDIVSWMPIKDITRDADVRIWRTLRRVDPDGAVHIISFSEEHMSVVAGDLVRDTIEFVLPDDITPGDYHILTSLHHVGSGVNLTRYRVDLVVRPGC